MKKTLRQKLIEDANVPENEISNYQSDLWVLYTPERMEFIRNNYEHTTDSFLKTFTSDVEWQDWYNKVVIEIVFGYQEFFNEKAR